MCVLQVILEEIEQATLERDVGRLHELANELPDDHSDSVTTAKQLTLAVIAEFEGDFPKALELNKTALELARDSSLREETARSLTSIAGVYYANGEVAESIKWYDEALAFSKSIGDERGVAITTGNIGISYLSLGDDEKALEFMNRSRDLLNRQGLTYNEANVLRTIGDVYSRLGDYPTAIEWLEKSMSLYESISNEVGIADVLGSIGIAWSHLGLHDRSIECYTKAIDVFRRVKDTASEANTEHNLGSVYMRLRQPDKAVAHYENSIALSRRIEEERFTRRRECGLAEAYIQLERYDDARQLLDVIGEYKDMDPIFRLDFLSPSTVLLLEQGKPDEAEPLIYEALELTKQVGLKHMQIEVLSTLKDLAIELDDFKLYRDTESEHRQIEMEIKGQDIVRKLAVQEKQREIDQLHQERERERAVLYSTLPPSVADRVIRGDEVTDHIPNASVMFLDIVGFTSISSGLSATDVVRILDEVFNACDEIATKHGLTKVKTIGDAYMAICIPKDGDKDESSEHESSHVARMGLASIEMHAAIRAFNLQQLGVEHATEINLDVRIGLHCGPIVAGIVGRERLQYDVWGDTVNVASRMESNGAAGRIHVTDYFARQLQHPSLITTERGEIEVKGKGRMKTFWLDA